MFYSLYVIEGASLSQISNRIGRSYYACSRRIDMLRIEKRSQGGNNREPKQLQKLFRLDQRVVLFSKLPDLHEVLGVSKNLLYKYRKARLA